MTKLLIVAEHNISMDELVCPHVIVNHKTHVEAVRTPRYDGRTPLCHNVALSFLCAGKLQAAVQRLVIAFQSCECSFKSIALLQNG